MPDEPEETITTTFETLGTIPTGSLNVNVDFNDLMERYGQAEAFVMLGDLKDLLA